MSIERLYLDALAEGADPAVPSRSRLLAAARERRAPVASGESWIAPFAGRVAAMDALLASASDADWGRVIVEGWTLQELVAHLAAKDGLIALSIGAPVSGPPVGVNEAMGRTNEVQEFERTRTPAQTRADWRAQADELCRRLASVDPTLKVNPGGTPLKISDHLLGRMLETWVHTDDVAKVIGVRLPHPVAEHLYPAADFCARLVPWTMLLSGMDASGRAVRLSLTGPGGGEWYVPLDVTRTATPYQGEAVDSWITCDVVEFCFLLGDRRPLEVFEVRVEGDAALARDVLVAAPALAGP